MKPLLLLLFLAMSTSTAIAELYKWVDEEGNISYSDQPPFRDAEQLTPPGLNTTPAVKAPKQKTEPVEEEEAQFKYSYFRITSPEQDATIRNNAGNFTIELGIKPALNTLLGHSISIFLDGKPVQENLLSTSASLQNIDRGSHSVTAVIKDKKGRVLLSSNNVTVHVHRVSILHRKQG